MDEKMNVSDERMRKAIFRMVKRVFDILASLVGLIVCIPIFIVISALILLEDHGRIFFVQERIGKDGKTFRILKFRTMRPPASSLSDEDRVTAAGRILRRCWLDELPQLINIFIGDMSFVGPRPESLEDVEWSKRVCSNFPLRESVRPGLTGAAQILGRYDSSPAEKLALDEMYIQNQDLCCDAAVLITTLLVFFEKIT